MSLCTVPPDLALIFDLDGVVIDSMPLHIAAWRLYLERHKIAVDDLVTRMAGRRNDEIVEAFFGGGLTREEVFRHGAAKEELFREMMSPQLTASLTPGIGEFLNRCSAVPTGLATNAEPKNVDFVLDRAGLRRHFDVIVDGHQVERAKPHPGVYLRAAQLLGFHPGNCIVFEDSPAGIEAARRAGAWVVAIRTYPGELPPTDFSVQDFLDPALDPWLATRAPRFGG